MNQGLFQLVFSNRRVRLAMLLIVVILFIYMLVSHLTNGHITVNTDSPNNVISLIKIDENGQQTTLDSSQGVQLKVTVPGGKYEISVNNRSSGITKNIAIQARHSATYQLNIPTPIEPVSVLSAGALGVAADKQQMFYLDSNTSTVYRLADSGTPEATGTTALDSAQWANTSFGIGQDSSNNLYVIRNGGVSPLPVPFGPSSGVSVSYSVSSSGLVYVSSGGSIYAGQYGESFHKVFSVDSDKLELFAGSNKLAIVASVGDKGDNDNIILVDASGKRLTSKTTNAASASWSPDGKQLAVISDWASGTIYDTSLNKVADLGNSLGSVVWLNSSALLYSRAQDLWKYDVRQGTGQILSSAPGGEQISGLFLSDDRSSVFLTAQSQNSAHILLRVGLTQQTQNVPAYYSGLNILFPSYTGQCSFSYTNFLHPVLLITAWSNTDTCLDAAKEELKADNLPISGFDIQFQAPVDD